jgi:hypothetical protein
MADTAVGIQIEVGMTVKIGTARTAEGKSLPDDSRFQTYPRYLILSIQEIWLPDPWSFA